MARIAVALSGGGNRAALFGLGVLLYLADAGKNADVVSISSVSGGSLTNAYVGQLGDFREVEGHSFWSKVRPFARRLAHRTLWADGKVWAYLVGLVVVFLGAVLTWWLPWGWPVRLLLSLVLLLLFGLAL